MNPQEHIRKPSPYLRRRIDMLDYEVEKNLYGQPFGGSNICIFFKSDIEYFESIMENSIDAMYYNYFSHIDDNSGEWAHEYLDMVNYIRNKYQDKIMKHYNDNCGSGSIPLKESIRKVLKEELNESTFFRRRVDMSSLDKKFFTNLNIVTNKYFLNIVTNKYLKKHNKIFNFNVFRTTVISYLIDDYRDNLSDEDYDNFPYDEVYNFLLNLFYDKIKDRYVEVFGGDINESENIKKVLSEELKDSLTDLIKTNGIERASKTVGGFKRLAKILELDLDDVDTQEMLVKNFIYHTKIDQIDVLFIEVRPSASGGKILTVNLKTDDTASNVTSWYVHQICNYFNGRQDSPEVNKKLFPFKVKPAWHPVFGKDRCKIFLNAEIVNDEEDEDLMESKQKGPREIPNELK